MAYSDNSVTRKIGIETEYLIIERSIEDALKLELEGVTPEFFRFMVEVVTIPHPNPSLAVADLKSKVEELASGVALGRYASLMNTRDITMADVTKDTDYYRWVFYEACRQASCNPFDLHYVGIHLNISDSLMDGDSFVRAVNMLRCFSFLFSLLTANSPFRDGKPCGVLSRRNVFYPNRYDVPFWSNEEEFKRWISAEEEARRIYPGKARCWMPVCPRLTNDSVNQPIDRIELRSLDGGMGIPWQTIEGCCELALRLIKNSFEVAHFPATLAELERNDKLVACIGKDAPISLRGRRLRVTEVAKWWCDGIPGLEEALECGSPADLALREFEKSGYVPQ